MTRQHAIAALALLVGCGSEEVKQASTTPIPSSSANAPATPEAALVPATDERGMPRIFEGACIGEGCMPVDSALVCNPVKLVAAPRAGAAEVGELRSGDSVAYRSVLHVRSPGVVVVRSDVPMTEVLEPYGDSVDRSGRLTRGDTLFLLYYEGEGRWRAWRDKHQITALEFWAGPADKTRDSDLRSADSSKAVAYSHPATDTWFEITRGDLKGWWLEDSLYSVLSLDAMRKWDASCRSPES